MRYLKFRHLETNEEIEIKTEEWYSVANKDATVYRVDAWHFEYLDTSNYLLVSLA